MTTKTVTIQNTVGLHARPATFFIQKANFYKSTVMIEKGTRRANAKSLLGVLSLGIEKGHDITIRAEGIDEAEAVEGLADLLLNGFND
ncbi:MAG: HPr family phosphocarrier protein [Ruminococcaceae bacterium]|nr:HPr family phosphocarrier protein [Oscillospiraceae bacterium]